MSYFAHSDELPEWAAHVPDGWGSDWLKWSVDFSTKRPTEEEQEALPYISNEDIASWTGKLLIEEAKPTESDSRRFWKDDVLFNKLRPYLAKVFHATFDGVSSGELLCLRPSRSVEPRFLFYVLVSKGFIDTINAETFGAKMPRADWEIVGHQPLPLPSLDTQRRIARFLDEKTARIDGLIEKKRALLDRLAEKRQALITRAVTKGLNPDAPMRPSGIDWLGDIPEHWTTTELRWITKRIKTGPFGAQLNSAEFVEDELPVINPSDILDGKIVPNRYNTITAETAERLAAYRMKAKDIVFARRGEMGRCALVTEEQDGWLCGTGCIVVTPETRFLFPRFSELFLGSKFSQEWFSLNSVGATMANLNEEILGVFPVIVPPLREQLAISDYIDRGLECENNRAAKVERSVELFEEYRAALITAAVTGQIAELQ